ncbi:hypothetical protein CBS101457_006788 [Exobasidium rhododendri]|nr:hypothetical protein CBS101457_006788 [Exobasidium rhododendri]
MEPCHHCVQINSVRPVASAPLCCLIRTDHIFEDNADGNTACALCFALGNFTCSAGSIVRPSGIRRSASTIRSSRSVASNIEEPTSKTPGKSKATTASEYCETMASYDTGLNDQTYQRRQLKGESSRGSGISFEGLGSADEFTLYGHNVHSSAGKASTTKSRKSVEFVDNDLRKGTDVLYQVAGPHAAALPTAVPNDDQLTMAQRTSLLKGVPSFSASFQNNSARVEDKDVARLLKRVEALEASSNFQSKYIMRMEKDLDEYEALLTVLKENVEDQNAQLIELQAERALHRASTAHKHRNSTRSKKAGEREDAERLAEGKLVALINRSVVKVKGEPTEVSVASSDADAEDDEAGDEICINSRSLDDIIRCVGEREERQRQQRRVLCLE